MDKILHRRAFISAVGAGAVLAAGNSIAAAAKEPKKNRSLTSSEAELREFFLKYIDALNAHQMHRMTEFVHENLVQNMQPVTRQYVIKELNGHIEAVPDFKWRVKDLVVEGDTVAARLYNIGTPAKRWLGVEPTGRTVETLEFAFHKVRDGKFYEMNYAMDVAGLMKQLGK